MQRFLRRLRPVDEQKETKRGTCRQFVSFVDFCSYGMLTFGLLVR